MKDETFGEYRYKTEEFKCFFKYLSRQRPGGKWVGVKYSLSPNC